jgi:hypothetical protein
MSRGSMCVKTDVKKTKSNFASGNGNRMTTAHIALAPKDSAGNDVDPVVASTYQVPRQWPRHPANATTNFQNALVSLQVTQIREIPEELIPSLNKVAVSHKYQTTRRNKISTPTQNHIRTVEQRPIREF